MVFCFPAFILIFERVGVSAQKRKDDVFIQIYPYVDIGLHSPYRIRNVW